MPDDTLWPLANTTSYFSPPTGTRGCGTRRATGYGAKPFAEYLEASGREPLVIRNLPETGYAASDPNVGQFGLRSYMGHPVERGPEVIGSICAVFQSDFNPTADDRRVLALIASALSREEDRKRADEERQTLHRASRTF